MQLDDAGVPPCWEGEAKAESHMLDVVACGGLSSHSHTSGKCAISVLHVVSVFVAAESEGALLVLSDIRVSRWKTNRRGHSHLRYDGREFRTNVCVAKSQSILAG